MTEELVESVEELEKILHMDSPCRWRGDNAMQGLLIISKYIDYMKKNVITWGEHDEIGSVGLEDIVSAGITKKDAEKLRDLNWCYQYGSLFCFV